MVGLPNEEIALLLGIATPKQAADVDAVVEKFMAIANEELPIDAGYVKPTVAFNLKGTTAGQAGPSHIRLNVELLHNAEHYEEMLHQTLPHEIAHCVVFQRFGHRAKAHGWEWQAVMELFGLPPNRTHSMPVKKARRHKKFSYVCKGCGHKLTFGQTVLRRLNNGTSRYRCNHCGTTIPQGLGSK